MVISFNGGFLDNQKSKDSLSLIMRRMAGREEVEGVAFVTESWVLHTEPVKDPSVLNNISVADHPDRQEAITVQGEWRGEKPVSLSRIFQRGEDGKVVSASDELDENGNMKVYNDTHGRMVNFMEQTI